MTGVRGVATAGLVERGQQGRQEVDQHPLGAERAVGRERRRRPARDLLQPHQVRPLAGQHRRHRARPLLEAGGLELLPHDPHPGGQLVEVAGAEQQRQVGAEVEVPGRDPQVVGVVAGIRRPGG